MAESDGQEKTEQPTSKKLNDAKNKGQIARSKEMGTAFVLISSAIGMLLFGGEIAIGLMQVFRGAFSVTRENIFDTNYMFGVFVPIGAALKWPLLKIFLLVLVASFLGNVLLGGFNFSTSAAMPKASKMSPLAGVKRMFGPMAWVELLKAILKFLLVMSFAVYMLYSLFGEILHLSQESSPGNMIHAAELLLWMFLVLCLSLLIIVAIDAPFQKWHHMEQLKMTKQEVKDEMKNQEGNPEVKGRIRRAQREAANRRMMGEVPTADVIVTNPTHYAVALRYEPDRGVAPLMVAKGADELALQIRRVGSENDVPIIESPTLARSIYYTTEIDHEIPELLFAAVAQVLAYVFQLKAYRGGKGRKPQELSKDLPIPKDLRY